MHAYPGSQTHIHREKKMDAQSLYINLTRLSMRSPTHLSQRRVEELNKYLPQLRQLLCCVVCCRLLMDPFSPKGTRCGHHVCRLCVRGRKRLSPLCEQCNKYSDYKTYEENRTMALLLLCYKTLCTHLLQSSLFVQLGNLYPDFRRNNNPIKSSLKLPFKTTQELIHEGANYNDIMMKDTFLIQPDPSYLLNMPFSLPAETPPTTAATTPDLPFEQHFPGQNISLADIEQESATTAEQVFSQPIPMMPARSTMLHHTGPQSQVYLTTAHTAAQPMEQMTAGFLEQSWNEQVDLSEALSMNFPQNTLTANPYKRGNFTYVLPTEASTVLIQPPAGINMPSIGQVVQIANTPHNVSVATPPAPPLTVSVPVSVSVPVAPIAVMPSTSLNDNTQTAGCQDSSNDDEMAGSSSDIPTTRMTLRNHKPKIISSVQVKPPNIDVATTAAKPQVKEIPKVVQKTTGCRCGTTSQPGNLTCLGRRCPCMQAGKPCTTSCKCRGCRNPYRDAGSSSEEDEPITKETTAALEEPGMIFVEVTNPTQSKHPLVLVQNEKGGFQVFNVFTKGNVPIDPAKHGFQRISQQDAEGHIIESPQTYIMPTTAPAQPESVQLPASKKLQNVINVETIAPPLVLGLPKFATATSSGSGQFSPMESIDEYVSGTTTGAVSVMTDSNPMSNAAAGDSMAADNDHNAFPDEMMPDA